MPSCVVKFCKNHSSFKKKHQGITFHRFPKTNEVWRKDLINIIRESRNENDWLPSQSSVICSVHFDTEDLYTTKGGRLRVATYAVPKNFLFETPNICEEPDSPNISIAEQEVRIFEPQNIREEPALPNICIAEQEIPPVKMIMAADSSFGQLLTIEQSSSSSSSLLPQSSSVFQATVPSFEEPLTIEPSSSLSSSLLLPRTQPEIGAATVEVNSEEPLSILYTPRERRLKRNLMMSQALIQKQKKKIKMLNQKVRRLVDRNKSLKDILKTLKDQNYVDTDLFNRQRSADITVADLFNNYNRKKLKKHIKISPNLKKFCLTLNYYSPKAYDYVRQTFNTCLPHRKTLAKWCGRLKGDPGFTEESFQALKAKAQVSQRVI